MTNKEAAEEIQKAIDLIRQDGKDWLDERDIPILEMAINALTAQPETHEERTETHVCDCISRKMAIDLFPDDDLESDTKGGYIAPHLARQMICELPSAQPKSANELAEKVQNAPNDDFISRKAAIEAIENTKWYHLRNNGVMMRGANSKEHQAWYKEQDVYKALEQLPSAQPETPMQIGWICPVCGRGLSPLTSVCPCNNGKGWEITC